MATTGNFIKSKNDFNAVNITKIDLKFGIVVAENHLQHRRRSFTNDVGSGIQIFQEFDQKSSNYVNYQHEMIKS